MDGSCPVVDPLALLAAGADSLPDGPVVVHDPVGGPIGVGVAEWLAGAGLTVALVTPDQIAGTLLSLTGDLADANTRLQRAGVRRELRALLRGVQGRSGPASRTCGPAKSRTVACAVARRLRPSAPRGVPLPGADPARCGRATAWRRGACSRRCSKGDAWPCAVAGGRTTAGPDPGGGRADERGTDPAATGRVSGKVALITGAARGQGRSHAVRLAAEGADIIGIDLCADVRSIPYPLATPDDLAETTRLVDGDRGLAWSAPRSTCGITEALAAAVGDGVGRLGRLDIAIANAGVCTVQRWDEVTPEVWDTVIGINLTGPGTPASPPSPTSSKPAGARSS